MVRAVVDLCVADDVGGEPSGSTPWFNCSAWILLGACATIVDDRYYIRKEQATVDQNSDALTHPTTKVSKTHLPRFTASSYPAFATLAPEDILEISQLKRQLEGVTIETESPMKEALFQSIAECTSVEPASVPACEEAADQNCPPP